MLKRFPLSFHEAQKKKNLSKISKLVMNGKSKSPILLPEKLERERMRSNEEKPTSMLLTHIYLCVCIEK